MECRSLGLTINLFIGRNGYVQIWGGVPAAIWYTVDPERRHIEVAVPVKDFSTRHTMRPMNPAY